MVNGRLMARRRARQNLPYWVVVEADACGLFAPQPGGRAAQHQRNLRISLDPLSLALGGFVVGEVLEGSFV
jgi:hypothetical protein